jgi:hypothetical protein
VGLTAKQILAALKCGLEGLVDMMAVQCAMLHTTAAGLASAKKLIAAEVAKEKATYAKMFQ